MGGWQTTMWGPNTCHGKIIGDTTYNTKREGECCTFKVNNRFKHPHTSGSYAKVDPSTAGQKINHGSLLYHIRKSYIAFKKNV